MWARLTPWIFLAGVAACGGGDTGEADGASGLDAAADATTDDRGLAPDAAPFGSTMYVQTITGEHRAVPGVMFGGWGPHLGHLVRAPRAGGGTATYWVDDLCSPTVPGDCDVNVNRRVGIFRRDAETWTQIATLPLPGVQQNTATIAAGGNIYTFGLASGAQRVIECSYEIDTGVAGCVTIDDISTGVFANYVGAAVGPGGARVVWWTNVVDGGGGSFSYLVDYGGGWNGPRTGAVGGYNDCAYAHAAFSPDGAGVDFFCQVVSGMAPDWSFSTLVGATGLSLVAPVVWANGLAPPAGDSIASTNDLFVEAAGGDAHLLARSSAGAVVYYFKPAGGAYGAAEWVLPATFRARWIPGAGVIAVVHDAGTAMLHVRATPRAALAAAGPLSPATWTEIPVPLPTGFGDVYAIYPVSPSYQTEPITDIELVVVGNGDEHTALYVAVE